LKSKSIPVTRSILIEKENIEYTLKYSRRAKYLRLQVKNRGELEVILPRGYQLSDAERFLQKKSNWIKKHISKKNNYHDKYFLLGEEIRVTHDYDFFIKRHKIAFDKNHLRITSPPDSRTKTEELFENWLRKLAKKSLVNRIYKLAENLTFKVGRISIRGQKTRWGSCSSKGNLSFNYNLLRYRKEVIDYVIIHELCHLKEMNHSDKFWKLVGDFCPDYKELRKELKNI